MAPEHPISKTSMLVWMKNPFEKPETQPECVFAVSADAERAPWLVIRAKDPGQKEMLEGTSPLAPTHLAKQGSKCSSMSPHIKDKDKDKDNDKNQKRCCPKQPPLINKGKVLSPERNHI